jgi:hypothetical protein
LSSIEGFSKGKLKKAKTNDRSSPIVKSMFFSFCFSV